MDITRSATKVPSLPDILKISGLEFMQGMLSGRHPGAPMAQTMGYELTAVEDGRVVFSGAPTEHVLNPAGTVHGGWYGTLLDSAMGCAVMTKVPVGSVYTTLEYKVNILRPIQPGVVIDCVGIVDHAGRSTGVAHAEIRGQDDGKLYATGSTTCIIMKLT
jgi:uncharacterized protein (TIGR00369 family)